MVEAELVLEMFSGDLARARKIYRDYMGEKEEVIRENIYATVDQRILGDERFVKEVMGKTGRSERWGKRRHEYTLLEIAEVVAGIWGVTVKQLREKGREEGTQTARTVASLAAKQYGYRGKEIGECLRRDPAVITRYLKE